MDLYGVLSLNKLALYSLAQAVTAINEKYL